MINWLSRVCSYAIRKIPIDGCHITFGLRPHVIQHPSIGIFPYSMNKQGITNSIRQFKTFNPYIVIVYLSLISVLCLLIFILLHIGCSLLKGA